MQLTTKALFEKCYGTYAIPAVNVFFMEEIHGLFLAAVTSNAPFIVQTTPFARDYAHPHMLLAMIQAAAEIYPDAVFAVHLDHGNEEHIIHAIETGGYQSVMIDASHDDFETNIARTKSMVTLAHRAGVQVEAELGILQGIEDEPETEIMVGQHIDNHFTDPAEVQVFVERTQCDSLAIAVGTSHGAYKFTGNQGIQFDILKEIQKRLPGYPLVLHGGSRVDPAIIGRINAAGGKLKTDATGVREEEIRQAIPRGICKINIATDMRLLWTMVNREFFSATPEEFAPTTPGKTLMKTYHDFMCSKFDLLQATGKAKDFY